MSAYVVDDHLIDFILTFIESDRQASVLIQSAGDRVYMQDDIKGHWHGVTKWHRLSQLGQLLIDENYRSVNYRYDDSEAPHRYTFRRHQKAFAARVDRVALQVLRALSCYDYQACESPDYRATDASGVIDSIRAHAISKLSGYEETEWGAPAHPASPKPAQAPRQLQLLH